MVNQLSPAELFHFGPPRAGSHRIVPASGEIALSGHLTAIDGTFGPSHLVGCVSNVENVEPKMRRKS